MARETAAQRNARFDAERDARLEVARATYTQRLMSLLARATKENFELEVRDQLFKVEDRDDRRASPLFLMPLWTNEAEVALFELEMAVEYKEEQTARARAKAAVREAALSKLTAEERQELGL